MRDDSNQQRSFHVFAWFRYFRLWLRCIGLLGHNVLLPKEICVEIVVCREAVVSLGAMLRLIYGNEGACECGEEGMKEAEQYT